MRTNVVVMPADATLEEAYGRIRSTSSPKGQHLFPVIGAGDRLAGVVTRNQLSEQYERMQARAGSVKLAEIATQHPQVAFADEPLRKVVNRMAASGFTRFPVLD